jgi:hypothetical protein
MGGALAWVAATRSGLTPWAAGWRRGPGGWLPRAGVVVPVAIGVEMLEGISDVKMLAEGERMYFWVMIERRAGTRPVTVSTYSTESRAYQLKVVHIN